MTQSPSPSRQVLDATPTRALTFLRAIAMNRPIRATLRAAGYTAQEHKTGWRLLHRASGYVPDAPDTTAPEDEAVRAAIVELDAWDEDGFRRVHAALARLHPAQDEFVFKGLQPGTGAASVVSVGTLLDRLDALESDPERKHTRKDDHAALETLTARGITSAERARLRGLVKTAESLEPTDPPDAAPAASNAADSGHEADLRALRAWFDDWSETARAVIKRRDHLIRLGLAKRKKGEKVPAAPSADAAKPSVKPAAKPAAKPATDPALDPASAP